MMAAADPMGHVLAGRFRDARNHAQLFRVDWSGAPGTRPPSGWCRGPRGGDAPCAGPFESNVTKESHGRVSPAVRLQRHDFAQGADVERIEIVWDPSDGEVKR